MDADIISLSLGGDPDPENPLGSLTADAVSDALNQGVFVVAAAETQVERAPGSRMFRFQQMWVESSLSVRLISTVTCGKELPAQKRKVPMGPFENPPIKSQKFPHQESTSSQRLTRPIRFRIPPAQGPAIQPYS